MEVISLNASKIQGSSLTLAKKVEDVRVKPLTEGTGSQNSVEEANSYNKYDTLELSHEYLEYKTKSENSAVKSDTNQLNSTIDQKFPGRPPKDETLETEAVQNEEAKSSYAATDDSEEEDVSSYNLSSYSKLELKSLVQSGKITSAAYNAEIKNRQVDDETEKEPAKKQAAVRTNNQVNKKTDNSILF